MLCRGRQVYPLLSLTGNLYFLAYGTCYIPGLPDAGLSIYEWIFCLYTYKYMNNS
jgi:hypothetical protein